MSREFIKVKDADNFGTAFADQRKWSIIRVLHFVANLLVQALDWDLNVLIPDRLLSCFILNSGFKYFDIVEEELDQGIHTGKCSCITI